MWPCMPNVVANRMIKRDWVKTFPNLGIIAQRRKNERFFIAAMTKNLNWWKTKSNISKMGLNTRKGCWTLLCSEMTLCFVMYLPFNQGDPLSTLVTSLGLDVWIFISSDIMLFQFCCCSFVSFFVMPWLLRQKQFLVFYA